MITIFSLLTIEETKATAKVSANDYGKITSILNKPFIDVTIGELVMLNHTPIFDWPYTTDLFNDLFERYGTESKKNDYSKD